MSSPSPFSTSSFQKHPSSKFKIAFVTGANKGIGKEIVRRLYKEPSIITIMACRNATSGHIARDEILESVIVPTVGPTLLPTNITRLVVCPLDLTNHTSIETAAQFTHREYGRLDILINNAAICFNDPTLYGKVPYTAFEDQAWITVQTNFFGTMKVIEMMMPLLLDTTTTLTSSSSSSSSAARIINIASSAGRLSILQSDELKQIVTSPTLTMENLASIMNDFIQSVQNQTHKEKGYPNTCYGMSKLGIIAMTKLYARMFPYIDTTTAIPNEEHENNTNDDKTTIKTVSTTKQSLPIPKRNILIQSVDPGYCATDQNNFQGFVSPERGALTPYLLATLSEETISESSGKHFFQEREIDW